MGLGPSDAMGKKSLCKLVRKDVHLEDPGCCSGLVDGPGFQCKGCGRAANEKWSLCKGRRP